MSTADGSQANPYIATTYTELLTYGQEPGEIYIKIGNNINIIDEYPDGNMPELTLTNCHIDGNNKAIYNWYKSTAGYCINRSNTSDYTSTITNLTFANIYITSTCDGFFQCSASHDVPYFELCNFHGVLYNLFKKSNYSAKAELKSCSLNLDLRASVSQGNSTLDDFGGIFWNNCYLKAQDIKSNTERPFFSNFYGNPFAKDSYFEIETTATSMTQYKDGKGATNSIFDITTNTTYTWGNATGYSCSIFRQSHAPNLTESNNIIAIDEPHWLDVSYIHDKGFNAG